MNEQDQFEYEVWATYQELQMDDVCNAINDSPAILRAIHNNNFYDATALIKHRVDTSVKRLAEYRMHGKYITPQVDPREEMMTYQKVITNRANSVQSPFGRFQ